MNNHFSLASAARHSKLLLPLALLALLAMVPLGAFAQTDNTAQLRAEAFRLIEANKYTEALPLLEKLALQTPGDAAVQRNLGFALLGQAKNVGSETEAKSLRARAHTAFVKARSAGDDSPLVAGMIESIPADGGVDAMFGKNLKADEMMQNAEAAFSRGNMDEALEFYQKALKIDPKLYHAALFSGDVYMHKEKYADAEVWYQRAIQIDPYIETAYRYSATPLMKQGKHDQARDRYVEAWIVEPYSKFAVQGMVQWGQVTGTRLGHPQINAPKLTVGPDGKTKSDINITTADDGSMAWITYVSTREAWRNGQFVKTFPAEKAYRHSMNEEADALRSVVKTARDLKSKNINEQILLLEKMDKDGVLEAYVLMATPDAGIARDHAAYVRSNREKLRQYVLKYVIGGK